MWYKQPMMENLKTTITNMMEEYIKKKQIQGNPKKRKKQHK